MKVFWDTTTCTLEPSFVVVRPRTAVTDVTAIPENTFGSNVPRPKTHQNPARMYAVRIKTNIGDPTRSGCIFVIGVTFVTDISDFAFWAIWKSFTLIIRSQLIKVTFGIRFGIGNHRIPRLRMKIFKKSAPMSHLLKWWCHFHTRCLIAKSFCTFLDIVYT